MTRLVWDAAGKRVFTAGVDRGVLYPIGKTGVPWNGLTKVSETPAGGTVTPRYRDGEMVANEADPEFFAATLTAMTYPPEFEDLDGTGSNGKGLIFDLQPRKPFHLSWRTGLGNDLEGLDYGYRIHLLYNAMASPSAMDYTTAGQTTTPGSFNWALSATPVAISGRRPTPHLIIDTTKTNRGMVAYLEDILYGNAQQAPRLPMPSELITLFDELKFFKIVQNTTTGMNSLVQADDADLFGRSEDGFYQTTPDTRLMPTGLPGEYTLEQ